MHNLDIGLTPRALRILQLAEAEARCRGHNYIGTEHLLLALIREGEGIAAGVLESAVDTRKIVSTLDAIIGHRAEVFPNYTETYDGQRVTIPLTRPPATGA